MALFGKKPKEAPPQAEEAAEAYAPSGSDLRSRVDQMRQQGYSDNQIITMLQNEGMDVNQIYDAVSQQGMPTGAPPGTPEETVPSEEMGPPAGPPPGMGPPPSGAPEAIGGDDRERIEELAETIIDEKWNELLKTLAKINEWKDMTESRITKLEQQMKDLKGNFDNLHTAIIGKIGEYDQNIINVGTEIKAMEKVFQKILPTFSENVSELSRIVGKLKK